MNRRDFLKAGATTSGSLLSRAVSHPSAQGTAGVALDVLRTPDLASARFGMADVRPLKRSADEWSAGSTVVSFQPVKTAQGVQVSITVEAAPGLTFIHLRWFGTTSEALLSRGDAWERGYGDLEWRCTAPDRIMPWYFLTTDGRTASAYGVLTGPSAFCFWQRDADGISLTLDLRNGGDAALLTGRRLPACTVVSLQGRAGEPIHAFDHRFCRLMCPHPRLPRQPIFGSNDWNYAYGRNTAEGILRDADEVVSLAGSASRYRPYTVIDDGYQDAHRFPDLAKLAQQIRERGAKPGIWIRPLRAEKGYAKRGLLLPAARFRNGGESPAFDPTIAEALDIITGSIQSPVQSGYEFIKHDFSTWELFGQWGFEMGATVTTPGWSFHDRTRTNAEIVADLYRALRRAAGEDTVILGCNTIGHIAAGIFDSQRISDDTSGRDWERTRRYGVNALAHRIAQHQALFHADPDIVAITPHIPWIKTQMWLDVVARSGTSLFIAPDPAAMNELARRALREAFAQVQQTSGGFPLAPTASRTPEAWRFRVPEIQKIYDWTGPAGADPFPTA